MIDLKLKNAWLREAKIDFLRGGLYDGSLALSLVFSGAALTTDSAADTLSTLLASSSSLPRDRLVRISGAFPTSDPGFLLFLQAMKKYKFGVSAVVEPEYVGPWLDDVGWVVIRTRSPFLMFQPNEIWYDPTEDVDWKDITMPVTPGKTTFFYLARTKEVDPTCAFFAKSEYHWQLA